MVSGITGRRGMGDGEDPRFFARHRASIIVGVVAVIVLAILVWLTSGTVSQAPVKQVETVTIVQVQPPKPPPPPPPPPKQMIQQPKITTPVPSPTPNQPPKPATSPKPAAPAASIPLGTSLKANGQSNNFDLSGTPGGNGLLGGGGGGEGGGCGGQWCGYAEAVQTQISNALSNNPVTRTATAGLQVQIYIDGSGRVTRVVLVKPSGNARVDRAIQDDVLMHVQLDPPPASMPQPLKVNLTGQEPL